MPKSVFSDSFEDLEYGSFMEPYLPWVRAKNGIPMAICEGPGENQRDILMSIAFLAMSSEVKLYCFLLDDMRNATGARECSKFVFARNIKFVVGHCSSNASVMASEIYSGTDVVFITPGSSSSEVTGPEKSNTLRFYGTDRGQVELLLSVAKYYKRLGVFYENNPYYKMLSASLNAGIASRGKVVSTEVGWEELISDRAELIYIVGSKEFSRKVLIDSPLCPEFPFVLSDDSCGLEEEFFDNNIKVAGIKSLPSSCESRFYQDASNTLVKTFSERPSGYFVFSLVAMSAVIKVLKSSPYVTCHELISSIKSMKWRTRYGNLSMDQQGGLRGVSWGFLKNNNFE